MDFPIRITPLLRPLLFPLRASGERAAVHVGGGHVEVEFGVLFHGSFALEQIEHVSRSTWPWWSGLGLRIGARGRVGLIGSLEGVVCIHFNRPQRVRAPLPWRCRELYLSLHDPDGFIATVEAAAHMAAA
ncbi:hypothetical protein [Nannocystis pusilla]|uniref:hypothetical protein n=1 Tax=Nannocystis pusilla TaxID=889268 RepID=UPI003DA50E1E